MAIEVIPVRPVGEPVVDAPAVERLLEGAPVQRIWNAYSDAAGVFHAGHWSSTRGAWRIRYTESELCVLLVGRVTLTSASGAVASFKAGDAFVVPAGFEGVWQVDEDCTKIYAICEPRT